MNCRVLVLGASGLLGFPTFLEAERRHQTEAHGTYRTLPSALAGKSGLHPINLQDFPAVQNLLEKLGPDVVINCAGIVKNICTDPFDAITVNAALPHFLANCLKSWRGRLVQVSTDCVFSGHHGSYSEDSTPDPKDLYGRTKLLGEVTEGPHLTIRTSFIGFEHSRRSGLLAWFLAQKGSVKGFRNAIWSGLTADRLAMVLNDLAFRSEVNGVLNVAGVSIDKDTLLRRIAEVFDHHDVTVVSVDEPRIDRSLNTDKLRELGIEIPPMREMLASLRRWQLETLNVDDPELPLETDGPQ